MHLLRALGEAHAVTYAFFQEPGSVTPAPSDLPFVHKIVPVRRPRTYSAGRVIKGLFGRVPLPVANYTSPDMLHMIRRLTATTQFDAVHLDATHLAAYLPALPDVPVFVDWHNIESEGMHRFAELSSSPLKRLYARITAGKMEAIEQDLLRQCRGHYVCSDRERRVLDRPNLAVIENGVDVSMFPPGPSRSKHRIVFVGLMAYHANVDAAVWFVRNVWPELYASMPDKTLTIVGAKPAPAVVALSKVPGVEVTGTVEDVRPYYAEAFAAIAPLRTGSGTRLKILEAMAARVPVVSSPIGAEGLSVTPGLNILLAETPSEWRSAFAHLNGSANYEQLTQSARRLVVERYDWQTIRATMREAFEHWMSSASNGKGVFASELSHPAIRTTRS
jgi:sugar transferase (PEP-CTERM/EpsH1 system associated)